MGLYDTRFSDMTPRDLAGATATAGIGFGLAALLMKIPGVFEYIGYSVRVWRGKWSRIGMFGKLIMLLIRLPLIVLIILPLLILFNWVITPIVYLIFFTLVIATIVVACIPFFGGGYMIACMTGADAVASFCR